MADRVELIVQLTGGDAALRSLKNLEQAMNSLNKRKLDLRIDKNQIDRDIKSVRDAMRELQQGKNEVTVSINGVEHVLKSVDQAREILDQLTDNKREITLETGALTQGLAAGKEAAAEMRAEIEALAGSVEMLGNVFNALSAGSDLVADFAEGIGGAFTKMSDMFGSSLTNKLADTIVDIGSRALIGDFEKIVSRYDIMSTFTSYMEAAGVTAEESAAALDKVNKAILGLPIGLDEAAFRLRRYQMFLGNATDATNLTVGIQNAILAGGSSAYMRNQSYQQIDRLLAAGKLNTSRQWVSLFQGLGVSLKYVAQEMGYAGMEAGDLAAGLTAGEIPAKEFLNALMRLGEGSSEAAQGLNELLEIYKGTLESWLSNIRFAAVRGGETILKALEVSLTSTTGKGLVGYLENIRGAMNDLFGGTGLFIRTNPQLITGMVTSVESLLSALDRFSASDTATMAIENLTRVIDLASRALSQLPVGDVEQFVAFATTMAGPLGRVFTTVSSGLGSLIGVFQRFKNFDFERLLDRIITEVQRLADTVFGLLSLIPDGLMTELMAFGLVWGRPVATVLSLIGGALGQVAAAIVAARTGAALSGGGLLAQIFALGPSAAGIAAAAVAIGAVAAAIGVYAHNVGQKKLSIREAIGLDEVDQMIRDTDATIMQLQNVSASVETELTKIEIKSERARELISELFDLNLSSNTEDGFKRLESSVSTLNALFPELNLVIDPVTGKLDEASQKALAYGESLITLAENAQKAKLILEKIAGIESGDLELEAQERLQRRRREENRAQIVELERAGVTTAQDWAEAGYPGVPSDQYLRRTLFPTEDELKLQELRDANVELNQSLNEISEQRKENLDLIEEYRGITEEINKESEEVYKNADKLAEINLRGRDNYSEYIARKNNTSAKDAVEESASKTAQDYLNLTLDKVRGTDTAEIGEAVTENVAESIEKADKKPIEESAKQAVEKPVTDGVKAVSKTQIKESVKEAIEAPVAEGTREAVESGVKKGYEAALGGTAENVHRGLFDLGSSLGRMSLFSEETTKETDENAKTVSESVATVNDAFSGLTGDDGSITRLIAAAETIKEETVPDMIASFERLYLVGIKVLMERFDQLIWSLGKTEDAVEDLARTMQSKESDMNNFASSIQRVTQEADIATDALNGLAAAVAALQGAEISIGVDVPDISGVIKPGVRDSGTGGPIKPMYQASGGFIPRGTDTVPAMLTPGEFVMRRSAVNAFGLDFMNRLNNIDIKAAVSTMLHRIPQVPMLIPAAYTYHNDRYDNRKTTNHMNVYTNNPEYPRMVMNRWAHAL